jgi:hypothetical protein
LKPDGKRIWMVYEQNGVNFPIRPLQITHAAPGTENVSLLREQISFLKLKIWWVLHFWSMHKRYILGLKFLI